MSAATNLENYASERKTPLEDSDSECVVRVALSEPVSVWKMDRQEIETAAVNIQSRRCDFAARQQTNPNDGKTHLVLVECKKSVRGDDAKMEEVHGQFSGGLKVLLHLAEGNANFPFDILTPVLVSPNYTGGVSRELLLRFPVEYNHGRKARIKAASSGVEINDKYVAVRGGRRTK